jgi:ABC-type transport system substrate-binding protein
MDATQKQKARKTSIAIFVTAMFLVTSVSSMALNATAAEERTFVIGMTEGVSSANPFLGILDVDYMFYYFVYEYLVEVDDYGNVIPNLAKSWWYMDGATAAETDPDADLLGRNSSEWPAGSIWEYNLTEGIYWSDGVPFDADDVVYTIALQIGANYPNFWAFQPYTKWIDHIQKVDQYKVRFFFTDRINASNPAIPVAYGSFIWIPILPKHVIEGYSPVVLSQSWTGVPTVGTGPFIGTDILENEIIAKEKITLVRNPEWERGLGKIYNRTCEIDKVVMKFYADEQTLVLDLKTKKIDATEITPMDYLSLKNATDRPPELKLSSQLQLAVYTKISHFNSQIGAPAPGTLNPARVDPALHRATALATDRDYIVNEIFKGMGVKGVGLLTPVCSEWYYDAYSDTKNISWFNVTSDTGATLYTYNDTIAHVMDFNVKRANEILNASGYDWPTYPNGYRVIGDVAADRLVAMGVVGDRDSAKMDSKGDTRYLKFEDITGEKSTQDGEISQYLAVAWKAIGVQMISTPVSEATWSEVVYGFRYEFTETYWSGDLDPNYLLYVPTSYSMDGWNEWGTPDPWYDYCYSNQAKELNKSKRMYWVHECEKYLFLSGTAFLTTCDPEGCYAYLDDRWTNWSDDYGWHPGYSINQVRWAGEQTETDNAAIMAGGAIVAVVAAATAIVVVRRNWMNKMLGEVEHSEKSEKKLGPLSGIPPEETKPEVMLKEKPVAQGPNDIVVSYDQAEEGN